jgi:hypothetical protein
MVVHAQRGAVQMTKVKGGKRGYSEGREHDDNQQRGTLRSAYSTTDTTTCSPVCLLLRILQAGRG